MGYDKKIAEEELKNKVASDYFTTKNFDSTQIIGKIDFCIAKKINKKTFCYFENRPLRT